MKPSAEVDGAVKDQFLESCADFLESVPQNTDLHTEARYAHPWFGPLDIAGWHALGGMHMGLHRRQIECILAAA